MRAAEESGEVYMGSMTVEEVPVDQILPNIAATAATSSGMQGEMPGQPHICNVTGQPWMQGLQGSSQRQDICAPVSYEAKSWEGNMDAVDWLRTGIKMKGVSEFR